VTVDHPHGAYQITCPHCGVRLVDAAKRLWILRGFILAARYGTVTLVGCTPCVRAQVTRELWTNLAAGWWCFPWGLGTPLVVLQNLIELLAPATAGAIEDALQRAGLDPDEVRVDARGFSGEQRRMLDAAYAVLGRAILADGRIDGREIDLACRIIIRLTGDRVSRDEVIDALLLADPDAIHYHGLRTDYRIALLRMALDVARTDGIITSGERQYLQRVASMLGIGADVLEEILGNAWGQHAADSRTRPANDDLARALACLEISDPTDILAVKAAYRRQMLHHHPDRAGRNAEVQARYHRKAQEINWAYDYLLRYAGVR
jgi:DnaJ-domain-containing protein 1